MSSLIICVSVSHGNTRLVADTIASVLGAAVVEPEEVDVDGLGDHALVGFGSGIYGMAVHPRLTALVDRLPTVSQPAFVFATHGAPVLPFWTPTSALAGRLAAKGFDVVGSFSCRGWDTWLPLRLVGGLNKGHPDDRDLARAAAFAEGLRSKGRSEPHARG
jgi:flavodoxin